MGWTLYLGGLDRVLAVAHVVLFTRGLQLLDLGIELPHDMGGLPFQVQVENRHHGGTRETDTRMAHARGHGPEVLRPEPRAQHVTEVEVRQAQEQAEEAARRIPGTGMALVPF